MKVYAIIKTIGALLPAIIALITSIEAAFPENKIGAEKLAMVKSALESVYAVAQDGNVTFDEVWPVVEKLIAGAVVIFKKTGKFKN